MLRHKPFALLMIFAFSTGLVSTIPAGNHGNGKETRFIVRIENISSKDGQTASDGARWPFALSPGLWVVHENEVRLFRDGVAATEGLERQAEDGNPGELVKALEAREHNRMHHGVFNTPVGASAPGPIGPGGAYEFTVTARRGMKLSLTTMFGQSNDWFYAPAPQGISLFQNGKPFNGDVTSKFMLYDAGTEKDEEPGIGPNQGPRQPGPDTGEDEQGVVHIVKKSSYGKTERLFRVTITPEAIE